jgi:PleD family two-component response regulator
MKEPWILIVDDNADDVRLIIRALSRNNRTEHPTVCSDASQALKVLASSETLPKLVLLDGELPGMDSDEFLTTLRTGESTRFLPVVLYSGHNQSQSVIRALSSGANSYVCKPFEFDRTMDNLGATLHFWLDVHCSPDDVDGRIQK